MYEYTMDIIEYHYSRIANFGTQIMKTPIIIHISLTKKIMMKMFIF